MSKSSDFAKQAKEATAIYEVIGDSGATYIFFWFKNGNEVTVARRKPAENARVSAEYLIGKNVKGALDDCGLADFDGTTYQKGTELLRRLRGE